MIGLFHLIAHLLDHFPIHYHKALQDKLIGFSTATNAGVGHILVEANQFFRFLFILFLRKGIKIIVWTVSIQLHKLASIFAKPTLFTARLRAKSLRFYGINWLLIFSSSFVNSLLSGC
jgi:hypothetical protein